MFNPNRLNIVKNVGYSTFVGIKRDPISRSLDFFLPVGFDGFPDDFEETKKLFGLTYKTLRKFLSSRKKAVQNQEFDGIIEEDKKGVSLTNRYDADTSLQYSKLVYFDSILDAYDELAINSLQQKVNRTSQIDYSQIHKYLHKAIYLNSNVIYIDEMELPKQVIEDNFTNIVELFSYIYVEIKNLLNDEIENPKVEVLAQNFVETHLTSQDSVFNKDTSEATILILKEQLQVIDQSTPYKDDDYYRFFDAIETFLYGEFDDESAGNIIWGVDKFSAVWEELCYAFAEQSYGDSILYADRSGTVDEGNLTRYYTYRNFDPPGVYIKTEFRVPFYLQLNDLSYRRKLRPDLVLSFEKSLYFKREAPYVDKSGKTQPNVTLTLIHPNNRQYKNRHDEIYENLQNEFHYDKLLLNALNLSFKPWGFYIQDRFKDKFLPHLDKYLKDGSTIPPSIFCVIDYKYVNAAFFCKESSKLTFDVRKQLVYELALQQTIGGETVSEFWIPYYSTSGESNQVKHSIEGNFCDDFTNSQIKGFQLDFVQLQNLYLSIL